VRKTMALRIKEVHPSVVGQTGNRSAFAVYDGSKLVYKTKRGGAKGSPMYGYSMETAERLLAKEEARRAAGGSAPKATRSSASTSRTTAKASRQKLDRQELTVSGCTKFLRDEGYSVSKKRGSSRKKAKTIEEMLNDGDISFMEAVTMGYEDNPRRRRRRKNPLEEWTYVFIHPRGEMQDVVMASSEADARKKAKAELEKLKREGWEVSADDLMYVEPAGIEASYMEDGYAYDYSLEAYGRNNPSKYARLRAKRMKDGRMRYFGFRNGKYGIISEAEYKKRIQESGGRRDSKGRFKKRKNPRAMRRLR